jgi:hypothetical protein
MLNYQDAVLLVADYWGLKGDEYQFDTYKTVEYPFGWLFFFASILSKQEKEKIGEVYFVLYGIYPTLIDKNTGSLESFNVYYEPPYHSNKHIKEYALKNGYEWKTAWEVEFDMNDKSVPYLKFE